MNGAAAMSVEMCEVTEMSSAGGDRGEHDPARRVAPGRRRLGARLGFGLRLGARRAQHQPAAPRDQHDQHDEQHRPAARLLAERGQRLHHERIGEQREEAADVARRIEEVRVGRARMIGAGEPGLQQRAVGREREERQADRDREQAEQPERRGRVGRRAPPPGAIASGRNSVAAHITTTCTTIERLPGRYFVSACA